MARISNFLIGCAVLGLAMIAVSAPSLAALAQEVGAVITPGAGSTTIVELPVGNWLTDSAGFIRDVAIPAIMGGVFWLAARIGPHAVQLVRTFQVEQMLARAVDFAINAVLGATKGKVLSVDVGHAVIAQAANYVIAQAPARLIEWVGGVDAIKRMVFARLDFDETVTAEAVGVYIPQATD